MHLTNQGLRKAAILVSSLDTTAADAVLDQLSSEQAQQVRDLVVQMEIVDDGEQQRVIDEFFHGKPPAAPSASASGVELDGRLAWLASQPRGPAPEEPPAEPRAFRSLADAETEKLARVLAEERPQTIALVLSHLPAAHAGSVLARFPAAIQTDIIHRLVNLEETDPEILREVEAAVQKRLTEQVQMQRRRVAGLKAITGILDATDSRTGMQILDNLAAYDEPLAAKLGPQPITFEELIDLDDITLAEVFDTAGPELMIPALFGAPPALVDRVLAGRPLPQVQAIRKQLRHPGPIRLRDVEDARQRIALLAPRLTYRKMKSQGRAA